MNDPELAIKIRNMNGVGPMVEPNPMFDPVDELACDECNTGVGATSVNVGTAANPNVDVRFRSYHITAPHQHVVILCDDDAR